MSKTRDKRPLSDVARTLQVDDGESLRNRALAAAAQVQRRPVLVVVLGDDVGRRARVGGASFWVGRGHSVDMQIDDPRISSRHFRIEDRGDGWALIDEGSTNGTRVNGEPRSEVLLRPNDKIEAGDTVLRFEVQDAADQAYDEIVQRMMHIDDLTGLYLRRRFDRELEEMIRVARRTGAPVGMLVMDLDGLKAINDAHGHLLGAHVIAESGKRIGEVIPDEAIAARFGGDEYVAACPGLDAARTAEIGEAIRGRDRGPPVREGRDRGAARDLDRRRRVPGRRRRRDDALPPRGRGDVRGQARGQEPRPRARRLSGVLPAHHRGGLLGLRALPAPLGEPGPAARGAAEAGRGASDRPRDGGADPHRPRRGEAGARGTRADRRRAEGLGARAARGGRRRRNGPRPCTRGSCSSTSRCR